MRTTRLFLALAIAAGCTKAPPQIDTSNGNGTDRTGVRAPDPKPDPKPAPQPAASIQLTSVAFADDCGGAPPFNPPAAPAPVKAAITRPADSAAQEPAAVAARRRCEQTAMQLSISATSDTAVTIQKIEVFDESGTSLGTLTASKPTRWAPASSAYEAWNEKVAAGETVSVSYVLSQPSFVDRWGSHNRTYTVKVQASVGGVVQPLQTTVMVVAQPAPMPT